MSPGRLLTRRRRLRSYSLLQAGSATVRAPKDCDELAAIFEQASEAGRRVTLRAGAHAFDDQSLGDDLVVSLARLNRIDPPDAERHIRVGPGATWGDILKALEPQGLVPAVMVTSSHATAGGTLASDCLSRCSPVYGREGGGVVSFDLLTIGGRVVECSPGGDDPEAQELFWGAIGGLGYLGAITSIVYRVVDLREWPQIRMRTDVTKHPCYESLAAALVPKAIRAFGAADPYDENTPDAIWSTLMPHKGAEQAGLVFTSTFTKDAEDREQSPLPLHRRGILWSTLLVLAAWALRVPRLANILTRENYARIGAQYNDDLYDFAFFMDAHARSKRIPLRFGVKLQTLQQTFAVPFAKDVDGLIVHSAAPGLLVRWLTQADAVFDAYDLTPTLPDILFVDDDTPCLMSSNAQFTGFAVSYAFETSNRATLARAQAALAALAEILDSSYHGRVSLVKNVCASQSVLARMYGERAQQFFALKCRHDPNGLLRNDFLMRTFGELYRQTCPTAFPEPDGQPCPTTTACAGQTDAAA